MSKRLSVRRRQTLFAVAATDGIASHRIATALGAPAMSVRNALTHLRNIGLVDYRGAWIVTLAGRQLVDALK